MKKRSALFGIILVGIGTLKIGSVYVFAAINPTTNNSGYEIISDSVVDPSALTLPSDVNFGQIANGRAYQQNMVITHNSRQYLAYYNAARHVCVARREVPDGNWEILELTDYEILSNDSHNVVSLGIAPADGTLHLAFDHHVDELHYRRSVIGATDTNEWSDALFGPVTNALISGNTLTITYPRFESTPDGNLIFAYRTGYPSNGDRHIHHYNTANGNWSSSTRFILKNGSFTDGYGTSTSRSGYLNPLCYDKYGRLHTSWVWRENADENNPGSKDNHDLMYLYSDDHGSTWANGAEQTIENGGRVSTTGITAVLIPRGLGLINSNAMTVDPQGRVHVIVRHCTDDSLAAAGSNRGAVAFGHPQARKHIHYWRDFNNEWHKNILPEIAGIRSAALVADVHGNLYFARVISGKLQILQANAWQQWTEWKIVLSHEISSKSEILIDQNRWKKDGILSIPYQETPNNWGEPSALHVIEIGKASGEIQTPELYQHRIEVTADAYVRNNGTQDGVGSSLYVKNATNNTYDRKTFLRFDIKRISLPVYNAYLKMHTNTVSNPTKASLFKIHDNDWAEETISWDNAPSLGERISYAVIEPGDTWVTWDLTEYIESNVKTGSLVSLALWIEDSKNTDLTFRSKEFSDEGFIPRIEIESASPYSEWANNSGLDALSLAPSSDINFDGIPNLIAYLMGARSVNETLQVPSIELKIENTGIRASIRSARQAIAFNPRIEQRTSFNSGRWVHNTLQVERDYYGTEIDRLSVWSPTEEGSQFFRYAVDP